MAVRAEHTGPSWSRRQLDLTLAALSAQTHPASLTEVIVVDDGTEPPPRLPEIAPENTRIVPLAPSGWGIAYPHVQKARGTCPSRPDDARREPCRPGA